MFRATPGDNANGEFDPTKEMSRNSALRSNFVERRRHTPRTSLIVVLSDNHVVSPDRLAERLPSGADGFDMIVVACAGQPANLNALQRTIRDAQFLLAPAGTSAEDLRELAMRQAPGDIVTLLSGALLPETAMAEREISMTS